jgi:hypothetical protein
MKRKLFLYPLVIASACNINTSVQTKAYIFERKMLDNGKLMVHYVFHAGKILLQDSSVIENKVLPQDSVIVEFKKENPAENSLVD